MTTTSTNGEVLLELKDVVKAYGAAEKQMVAVRGALP